MAMKTYFSTYKLYPNKASDAMTLWASMDAEAEQKSWGPEIELVGRWNNASEGTGTSIVRASSVKALQAACVGWLETCELDIRPALTDDEVREIMLGEKPSFTLPEEPAYEPEEGEVVWMWKARLYPEQKVALYTAFAAYFFCVDFLLYLSQKNEKIHIKHSIEPKLYET